MVQIKSSEGAETALGWNGWDGRTEEEVFEG